jgi:methylmalonyl-CoA/ethylmalonyl-CoA epimerase
MLLPLSFKPESLKLSCWQQHHPIVLLRNTSKKKGEGIHHIAFAVSDIEAEVKRLIAEGFQPISEQPKRGADNKLVFFFHPKSTNGVLIELCQDII